MVDVMSGLYLDSLSYSLLDLTVPLLKTKSIYFFQTDVKIYCKSILKYYGCYRIF